MNEPQFLQIKIHCASGQEGELRDFLLTFNTWIQNKQLDDLCIDVADYSHMKQGVGMLLAAHEANYSIDDAEGLRGLLVGMKVQLEGSLEDQITAVFKRALKAAALIEADANHKSFQLDYGRLKVIVNDRLYQHTDENYAALEQAVKAVLAKVSEGDLKISRESDSRRRVALDIDAQVDGKAQSLLEKI